MRSWMRAPTTLVRSRCWNSSPRSAPWAASSERPPRSSSPSLPTTGSSLACSPPSAGSPTSTLPTSSRPKTSPSCSAGRTKVRAPTTERTTTVERVGWADFLARFAPSWRQGEHVSVIGPTGQGKSTLVRSILPRRQYVAFLATKPKDVLLDDMVKRDGFRKVRRFADRRSHDHRLMIWPKYERPSDVLEQARVMRDALDEMFPQGNWAVVADEGHWLCKKNGCASRLEAYWQQGRSMGLTLITN